MATQTVKFATNISVATSGGTMSARMLSTDTALASITEDPDVPGRYSGTLTDHAAGDFELIVTWSSYASRPAATWWVRLAAETGTYQAVERWELSIATIDSKLTTERLGKIDGAMQTAGEGITGESLSGQIDAIEGGGSITDEDITEIADVVTSRLTSTRPRTENVASGSYAFTAGDTWIQSITAVVDPDTVRLILTIKRQGATDDDSILRLSSNVGAERLNSAPVSIDDAAKASIDFTATAIDIEVNESLTLLMPPSKDYVLTVKGLSATKAKTYERSGELIIHPVGIYELPAV